MGECLIIRGGGGTDTSDATAIASVVLSGYTCYVNDQLIAGSMPVQTLNQKLGAGGSVTIPAGYYDGSSSVISTSTLAEETAANAASSHILSGYTGWVNGTRLSGSMTNRGNVNQTLAANGSYIIPAGWHAGSGKVSQSLTKQGAKTVTPKTTNQTAVAANRWTTGNIVVLGFSALTAGNIKNGVRIFGVLGNFTGWVDSTAPASLLGVNVGPDYTRYYTDTTDDIDVTVYSVGVGREKPRRDIRSMVWTMWNQGFPWLNWDIRFNFDTGNNYYGVGILCGPQWIEEWTEKSNGELTVKFGGIYTIYTYYNDEDGYDLTFANRHSLISTESGTLYNYTYFWCGVDAFIHLDRLYYSSVNVAMTYCNVWLSKS